MKIYVAKTLAEYRTKSTCKVKLSTSKEEIEKCAKNEADVYADTYFGTVKHPNDSKYVVYGDGITVTVTIEEHEV